METVVLTAIVVGLIALFLWMLISGRFSRGAGGGFAITAFHDMQPKDKQEAVEVIIDQNAGKRRFDLTNGKSKEGEELKGRTERISR